MNEVVVPWPWPLAPLSIVIVLGLAYLVLYSVWYFVIRGEE